MSRGKQLQEMDPGTKQSKTAVNANAKPADSMDTSVAGSYEDLGGPTPDNYKPDDDSAKLKTPGGTLKQVKDVVNKGAKPAMKGTAKEDLELDDQEVVAEEPATEEEVVAENEISSEEEVVEVAEYDMEEDVNALLGGEDLSEDFKAKAKTIFETAINAKVAEVKESLEAQYQERLDEEIETAKESLAERVDSYLEYVADEWFEENQLAVENGLKTEMTESFLEGMKSLFEDHYVTIPEEKYDVLNSMVEKLDEMEDKLNEQINKNVALNKRLSESAADVILADVSEGLAVSQKDKLHSLAENVEFDSEDKYREKLETLRESYFPANPGTPKDKPENLSEGTASEPQKQVSSSMEAYMASLGRMSK